MDIGVIILDPLEKVAVPQLLEALRQALVDPAHAIDASTIDVAFSAHPELGARVVVHFHDRSDGEVHDPFRFFADLPGDFGPGGLGPGVSGYLCDAVGGDTMAPIAWTCLYERRCGEWLIYAGGYYTFESGDESAGAFERLSDTLGVRDEDLLRSKLELPDTPWCAVTQPMPADVAELLYAVAT